MKKYIVMIMVLFLITGCSGRKESEPSSTAPAVKPMESDLYEKFYGTWRTCAISVEGVRLSDVNLQPFDQRKQVDIIFVITEDKIMHAYAFRDDLREDIAWSGKDEDTIVIEGSEFTLINDELVWQINDDYVLYLSKISSRQDQQIIDELIEAEDAQEEPLPEEEKEPEPQEQEASVSDDTIRPEVKEAIDAYEAFIDEYCDFMKRYEESDGTDLGILTDYLTFLSKLKEYADKMDKMEDDLTDAEYWYYIEVLNRCNEKLLKTY